ncbi:hypothetical protein WJX73_001822 [Symbiochloris irregularis]|uniref:Uncharacterized protein n=1 Tax=Symbiochloris irregularis TaxID=706552 RepID=A0AAW1NNE0_9CHLO
MPAGGRPFTNIYRVNFICSLTKLTDINVRGPLFIRDLQQLANLPHLSKLHLIDISLSSFQGFQQFKQLNHRA